MRSLHSMALRVGICALWLAVSSQALAQQTQPSDSRTWLGQEQALEQYIIEAEVMSVEDIGTGVTNAKVATLSPGGPVERVSFKPVAPGLYRGFWESYKSEIAAYELDKLLSLGMTPTHS